MGEIQQWDKDKHSQLRIGDLPIGVTLPMPPIAIRISKDNGNVQIQLHEGGAYVAGVVPVQAMLQAGVNLAVFMKKLQEYSGPFENSMSGTERPYIPLMLKKKTETAWEVYFGIDLLIYIYVDSNIPLRSFAEDMAKEGNTNGQN